VKSPTTTKVSTFLSTNYAGRTATIDVNVSGYNPSGMVTIVSNGTVLGTASLSSGGASLQKTFNAGTYSITANYPGDASNLPSVSDVFTLNVVPAPDFSLSATPMSSTVKEGATAVYTVTVTSMNGYSGTVMLNCLGCTGAAVPLFVTSSSPASVQITLTAPSGTQTGGPRALTFGVAQAGLLLLMGWSRRGLRTIRRLPLCVLVVGLAIGLGGLSGCSSGKSSDSNQPPSQSTTYNVVIVGSDASIDASHSITLQLVVTQ
jgi:hypothetical protein